MIYTYIYGIINNIGTLILIQLDIYEDYPILYKKIYFIYNNKKIMTYTMCKKTSFAFPTEKYLNVVKKGYKDCKLNNKYLIKALKS